MFKCECGKEFENSQAYNGHKSNCKEHQLAKYGTLDRLKARRLVANKNAGKTRTAIKTSQQQFELQKWLTEQHTCERCGKILTEKFGSGRFCSRSCANARELSGTTKTKISESVKRAAILKPKVNTDKYCKICGKKVCKRNKTNICNTCLHNTEEGRKIYSQNCGGYRLGSGVGKHGWYKGYYCDSTYELVYIIYCLDHNITFKRNTTIFYKYLYKGEEHKYYPDFIVDSGFVEIKGYHTELVDIKAAAITDKQLTILYKSDMVEMFDYIKNTYNYKKLTDLYE
ncbi:MAG: hypothetical protein J6W64_00960 [Bacilli bacterium]|nr:hypothetical protein [Bacilli bacterium]